MGKTWSNLVKNWIMLLQFDLNHINKVNFYPSNNNLIQALLVLLITNMISADNDDDDKHPLLIVDDDDVEEKCSSCRWWWMIEGMMTIVRFMVLQMRLKSPPSPDPPTSQSYWQRAVLYRILYCATYSTVPHTVLGSPQLSWRNATGPKLRPQTAPRHDLKATKRPLPHQTQSTFRNNHYTTSELRNVIVVTQTTNWV